jgi:hypothetical protein
MAGRWLANGRWTKNVKSSKKLRDPEKPNPAFRFQPRPTPHPPFQVLMNSNHIQTLPAQNHMSFNRARYLPTYEECNAPYSLRLPSYRSSHVRRFHPYARYAATFQEDYIVSIKRLRCRCRALTKQRTIVTMVTEKPYSIYPS